MAVTAVRLWRAALDQDGDPHRWLSHDERARAARYASPEEGRRFAVARAVLRSVLGEACGLAPEEVVLGTEDGGRPIIVPCDEHPPPDFNLSHSGRWALIAVAPPGFRVGVDLEWDGRDVDCLAMARTMFQPAEFRRLAVLDGVARRREFFRLWTAKEAYVKADGAGVAGLRAVLVDGATARSSAPSAGFPAALPVRWFAAAPGYPAALVVSGGGSGGPSGPLVPADRFLES
ncbi:4'-phosphopantetheinyl transferase [Catenulispora acidiphila DSM 44928]|uniref:4'-phosphopantetheinyl transferase n=1 Tax=Catenulispora acidiphila (strain DSM 44928 / JCM 14897 / NBRC 102108 / NRRL B-24433 / ID139908) TaxID=479433 RepID=C7Q569_CATAD|nr:4'-phosphopantetheinyl transferase [Catenulispora acidiphila DSM 44928]